MTLFNSNSEGKTQRALQVSILEKIVRPVFTAASTNTLGEKLAGEPPTAASEAFCRCLVGIAPWLELVPSTTEEGMLRKELAELAQAGIPHLPLLNTHRQNLVEAGFLAQALLRSPTELWRNLEEKTQNHIVDCLRSSRKIIPSDNNWVLFSALVETALWNYTQKGNPKPILHALKRCEEWYLGDGVYKDGNTFHLNYYNSFIILPSLWEILEKATGIIPQNLEGDLEKIQHRARRHAQFLENLISPEGTFPIIGRSSSYRFGALHLLALCALKRNLPENPGPAATRNALTHVIQNTMTPQSFTQEGWLQTGVVAAQPNLGNYYINTGSLYACCLGFAALGLPARHYFWDGKNEDWTQKAIWTGQNPQTGKGVEEPKTKIQKIQEFFSHKKDSLRKRIQKRMQNRI